MNKISVVVPVFNMEQYMSKALNSLLKQTYDDFEILLIDDGSTDGSSELCDEYAQRYDNVRTIHKENGGLSSARNAGIQHATGDYIIFPDPDDWVCEDYLETLVELKNTYNSDLEICGYYVVDDRITKIESKEDERILLTQEEAINKLFVGGGYSGFACNKLYHLDIIRNNGLSFDVELGMAQDLHFAFRYMLYCQTISYTSKRLYYYYQHIGGVTNIKAPLTARKKSGLKTYEKLIGIAEAYLPQVVPAIRSTLVNLSLQFMYIYYDSKMQDEEFLQKLKDNIRENKVFFVKNKNYSLQHKALGCIGFVNGKLYYRIRKLRHP